MSDDQPNDVEVWRDADGVLVSGEPEDVARLVEHLTTLGGADVAASPITPPDALAVFFTGYADGATSGQYIRFTDESLALLERHGAVPAATGGYHPTVWDETGIVGNLRWVPTNAGPERAIAFQTAAVGLALRTAVKSVEAAVARVEDKVDQVAALVRADRLGNVLGDRRTLDALVAHLDAGDPLSATDWSSIASLGPAITRDLEKLRAHLRSQLEEVDGSWRPRGRVSEADHLLAEGMLSETLGLLLLAEHNVSQWQRLRIQRIADDEPDKLAAAVRQAKAAMQDHLDADREFLALFASVQDVIFEPRDLDGLAVIQTRRLRQAETELSDLTRWFAEQRLLEFEATEQRDRPGLKESVNGVIDAGRNRLPALPTPALPRPGLPRPGLPRRSASAEDPGELMAADMDGPHPYRWAVEGPPLGRWRTFEGTFSNVMATELTFAADGTGTVTQHSGMSGVDETPIRWRHLGPGELWICHVVDDEPLDIEGDGDVVRYEATYHRSDAGASPVLMNERDREAPPLADEPPGWIPNGGFWVLDAPLAFLGPAV